VREADLLAAEPAAAAALASAACTAEQAQVIAAALRDLPEVPPDVHAAAAGLLVEQAQALDPAALARAGRHLHETLTSEPEVDNPAEAAALDADAQRDADRVHALRSLTWRRHLDGSVSGRFRLDPLGGETLLTAINALTARRDQVRDVNSGEPALLTEPVTLDDRTTPQRRADALASLAGLALDGGQLPTRGGIRPTLVVTTTLEALQGRLAASGLLPLGGRLDPASLRRIACDAQVIPAVLDGAGHPLDLGRTRRLFSPAQRRALTLRDGGCVHPGCGAPPAACEAHHLTAWYDGGATDLSNGGLLCDVHHDQHHRQGWRIRLDARGYPEVLPPRSIDPAQRPRQHIRFTTQRIRT
jgi:hypothetical protein